MTLNVNFECVAAGTDFAITRLDRTSMTTLEYYLGYNNYDRRMELGKSRVLRYDTVQSSFLSNQRLPHRKAPDTLTKKQRYSVYPTWSPRRLS